MFDNKYSKFLTFILIVAIIAIVGLIGFIGYDFYRKYYIDKDAEDFMASYEQDMANTIIGSNTIQNSNTVPTVIDPVNEVTTSMGTGSSSGKKTYTYKGFNVLGSINIPKTGINYPIIDTASKKGIETSVAYFYGPGPNQVGNTTIVGHNYRNGSFFGKNKRLANGDIIYITDNSGAKIKYTIYNIYTTTPDDGTYLTRDTNGKREVSLSTCTDDSKGRLVIWAREG
ncbi:MAG: sortase [Clostridia bacterium]|jgi:LPXTG-site transpeptidase (sortase) family protein|nr:sortase [Clostridia bacterium]